MAKVGALILHSITNSWDFTLGKAAVSQRKLPGGFNVPSTHLSTHRYQRPHYWKQKRVYNSGRTCIWIHHLILHQELWEHFLGQRACTRCAAIQGGRRATNAFVLSWWPGGTKARTWSKRELCQAPWSGLDKDHIWTCTHRPVHALVYLFMNVGIDEERVTAWCCNSSSNRPHPCRDEGCPLTVHCPLS